MKGSQKIWRALRKNQFAILLAAVYIVAANYFFGYICPSMAILGFPCPWCGMTRAALALAALDMDKAWQLNPMVFLLVPLICTYGLLWFLDKNTRLLFYPAVFIILASMLIFIVRIRSGFGSPPLVINLDALVFKWISP